MTAAAFAQEPNLSWHHHADAFYTLATTACDRTFDSSCSLIRLVGLFVLSIYSS